MTDDWIEWTYTDEKPYPETLDTEVIVKFRDDTESTVWAVDNWYCKVLSLSHWHPLNDSTDIIAYKVVE